MPLTEDNVTYCDRCWEEPSSIPVQLQSSTQNYCQPCADATTTTCNCGQRVLNESTQTIRLHGASASIRVCNACTRNYGRCNECSDYFHNADLDNGICSPCRASLVQCRCSRYVRPQNQVTVHGRQYCQHCVPQARINRYGFKPDCGYRFYRDGLLEKSNTYSTRKNKTTPLYFGLELEWDFKTRTARDEFCLSVAEQLAENVVYFCSDSSLGQYGAEMILHPHDMRTLRRRFKTSALVPKASHVNINNNTGLHVNINRTFFPTNTKQENFVLLIHRLKQYIFPLTRRESDYWCNYITSLQRENALRCPHRSAVNCENEHRLEVRIFRISADVETILSDCALVEKCALFAVSAEDSLFAGPVDELLEAFKAFNQEPTADVEEKPAAEDQTVDIDSIPELTPAS